MTAHAGDAMSHENLQRASTAILDGDRPTRIAAADIAGNTSPNLAEPSRFRSARICMAGMSGANRAGALHLNITWTQLPPADDDFPHQ
jgi:hypothetical protein